MYEYEKADDFDEWSVEERLYDIVKRLQYISTRDMYRKMRLRYASEEQYNEEFGPNSGHEELLHKLWFSAKEDYCRHKDMYDTYLENNQVSENTDMNLQAMRKVIDEEIDNMLLDTED